MSSRLPRRVRSFSARATYDRFHNSKRYKRLVLFIQRKPFTSFFTALGLLLFLLILGSILTNLDKKELKTTIAVKAVQTYTIGKTPTVSLQSQVQKNGVVKIVAQAPGIVQTVHVHEGDTVTQGQSLVSLSSKPQVAKTRKDIK